MDCSSCMCPSGYQGNRCETDVDECSSIPTPCINGDCTNKNGGYTCDCSDGYEGPKCEVEINECLEADCVNGATCVDKVAGYSCECRDGSSGERCEECDVSDCQRCDFVREPIRCAQCKDGYTPNDDRLCGTSVYSITFIHTYTHTLINLCI